MKYEKLLTLSQINKQSPRKTLIQLGFLSEQNNRLACCSTNANPFHVSYDCNQMLPTRFWFSIKDDMVYICKADMKNRVLAYHANIELKNIRFVTKMVESGNPSYFFEIKNENGCYKFILYPANIENEFYAQVVADYIANKSKEVK